MLQRLLASPVLPIESLLKCEAMEMKRKLNIALPKGRLGEKAYKIFESIGYGCPEVLENSRKLIFENEENGVCYFWAKPATKASLRSFFDAEGAKKEPKKRRKGVSPVRGRLKALP